MDLPTFVVHLESSRVLSANAEALALLDLSGRDDLIGTPLAGLFPDLDLKVPSSGARWTRIPNGHRRCLRWLLTGFPGRIGEGLLVVDVEDSAGLELSVSRRFIDLSNQLERGASAGAALHGAAGALHELLDLRLVRVLYLRDGVLLEQGSVGDGDIAAAARLETPSEGAEPDPASPALRAGREVRPVQLRADSAVPGPWHAALDRCGVRSILAWPFEVSRHQYVLELYAGGPDDFDEPVAGGLLRRWLPWLQERLSRHAVDQERMLAAEALQGAATPAFITDTQGTIVWLNRAFTEVYGHSEAQALGATPRLIKSGLHGPRYYRALWSALRSGCSWSGETVDRGADGTEVVVRQTVSPVRHGGRITHFLSIHANTTEEAHMRQLRERERGVDEISGLLTRAAFEERARQAIRAAGETQSPLAWMLCSVSNSFGTEPRLEAETLAHVRGILGRRLMEIAGPEACVGELESFEFVLLLRQPSELAAGFAADVAKAVCEPLPLLADSLELRCHTSIARFPAQGRCVEELRLAADRMLAASEPSPAVFPAEATFCWLPGAS